MFNPAHVSAQLSHASDSQLRQIAQMHKTDPYIMALAVAEANRRQQMRATATAMPQQGEQPKVVDQEIAMMTSQPAGITQLPAQNVEGMRDGGIVGYAEGDVVQGSPVRKGLDAPWWSPEYARAAQQSELTGLELERLRRKLYTGPADDPMRQLITTGTLGGEASPAAPAYTQQPTGEIYGPPDTRISSVAPSSVVLNKPTSETKGAAKLEATKAGLGAIKESDALAQRRKEYEDAVKETEGLKFPERDLKAREERIAADEAKIGREREDNLNMALVQAGLAMMGGTSQYAFENIGKGAMSGLQAYASGKKDIRDLEKDIQSRKDKIEDLLASDKQSKAMYEIKKLEPKVKLLDTAYQIEGSMQIGRERNAATIKAAQIHEAGTDDIKKINAASQAVARDEVINQLQAQVNAMPYGAKADEARAAIARRQSEIYSAFGLGNLAGGTGATMQKPGGAGWGIREIK